MFRKLFLITLMFLAFPMSARGERVDPLVKAVTPCIQEEVNGFRRPLVEKARIVDKMVYKGVPYFEVRAEGEISWNFYIAVKDNSCSVVAAGFPTPDLAMHGLPHELAVIWSEKYLKKRIKEVGKRKVKEDLLTYQGQLQTYELEAAKKLGVLP